MAHTLEVEINEKTGGSNAKRHRAEGKIPAVVSSHGDTTNILVNEKALVKMLHHGFKKSSLVELTIPGQDMATSFIKKIHRDPVTRAFMSIEFYKVTFGEKIQAETDIKLTGNSVGVKMGGILERLVSKLEIECLPKDLPEEIQVDVSNLDMGDSITIGDITPPEGVVIMNDANVIIANVHAPKKAKAGAEEGEAASEAAEGEAAEGAEQAAAE